MRFPDIRNATIALLAAAGAAFALAGTPISAAGAADAEGETYEWSAKLMAFDEESNTAIIQARVVSEIDGLASLSEGERLILIWSGLHWAAGVRGLEVNPELTPNTLSLPVEFVSSGSDGQYVNFRIPVPKDSVEAIAQIHPGMRVTGTSPKMPDDWSTAVHSLRHYNDVD